MSDFEFDFRTIQHFDDPFVAHELTFSCFHKKPFLNHERSCQYLAHALRLARKQHSFHLWAYVFMPEHVHLLVWPSVEQTRVDAFLKTVKQSVSRREIDHVRRNNPSGLCLMATGHRHTPYRFWQDGPGYDRNVRGEAALLSMLKYIHNNPVRRKLVQYCEEWKWSSALDWSGQGKGPVELDIDSFPTIHQ